MMEGKCMWPSRKWWAARIVALTGLATLVANAGAWTKDATIMAITVVSAAALAWVLPNADEEDPRGERGVTEPLSLLIYAIVAIILLVVLLKVVDRL